MGTATCSSWAPGSSRPWGGRARTPRTGATGVRFREILRRLARGAADAALEPALQEPRPPRFSPHRSRAATPRHTGAWTAAGPDRPPQRAAGPRLRARDAKGAPAGAMIDPAGPGAPAGAIREGFISRQYRSAPPPARPPLRSAALAPFRPPPLRSTPLRPRAARVLADRDRPAPRRLRSVPLRVTGGGLHSAFSRGSTPLRADCARAGGSATGWPAATRSPTRRRRQSRRGRGRPALGPSIRPGTPRPRRPIPARPLAGRERRRRLGAATRLLRKQVYVAAGGAGLYGRQGTNPAAAARSPAGQGALRADLLWGLARPVVAGWPWLAPLRRRRARGSPSSPSRRPGPALESRGGPRRASPAGSGRSGGALRRANLAAPEGGACGAGGGAGPPSCA